MEIRHWGARSRQELPTGSPTFPFFPAASRRQRLGVARRGRRTAGSASFRQRHVDRDSQRQGLLGLPASPRPAHPRRRVADVLYGEGGGPGDRGVAAFGMGVWDCQYQLLACQKDQASQALP